MASILKTLVFISGTAGIVFFSWKSLKKPQSHGYYRFFAWEFILALFIFNAGVWFRDPFSTFQIISWILLILSIFLAVHGVQLLKKIGQPDKKRDRNDISLMNFEKTTALVTEGAYKYIRHPLYSSLLFLNWGIFFKNPSWPAGIALALAASIALFLTARKEENENILFFGRNYETYIARTKMFIPFIF